MSKLQRRNSTYPVDSPRNTCFENHPKNRLRVSYVRRQLLFTPFAARLQQAFPGSNWEHHTSSNEQPVPDSGNSSGLDSAATESAAVEQRGLESPTASIDHWRFQPTVFAVIGGTKFDEAALTQWVEALPQDAVVVTGDGRGAEKALRSFLSARGIRVDVPTLLDYPRALDGQSERICAITQDSLSPIVLIGSGGRVNSAKKWLARGKWGREVYEV